MLASTNPEINVEELMRRIREEVALRKQKVAGVDPSAIKLPRMSEALPALAAKDAYHLEEFLAYHDEDFVNTLYRAVLHREPDAAGRNQHLQLLRQGGITKPQLVLKFALSPEGQSVGVHVADIAPITLPNSSRSPASIDIRGEYQIAEFLNFHDEDFIHVAYRGILHREADPQGYWRHLNGLRHGELSKTDILGSLRYSPEGKAAGVAIKGLWLAFTVRRAFKLPVIGYLFALANYLLRLPTVVKNFERFEANQNYHTRQQIDTLTNTDASLNKVAQSTRLALDQGAKNRSEIVKYLNALVATTEGVLQTKAATAQLEALAAQTDKKLQDLNQAVETKAATAQLEALAAQTDKKLQDLSQAVETKASTVQLEALAAQVGEKVLSLIKAIETKADNERLTALTNHLVVLVQRKADAAELAATATLLTEALAKKADVVEEDHQLDAFYASFEDRFRGTREDIKQRVAVYLPIVKEAKAGIIDAPILDVGCGRGEWLQLLLENHLVARGVDLNSVMVRQCEALGLEVAEADVIDCLRKLDANSLGAVTGMHIIEHMPFRRLIALFDEVLRVLRPGGVAIFETPNPENLIVGACNFYCDPTHINPLPPEPMKFVMESRGFTRVEIMRLHPHPESAMLTEGAAQVQQVLNGLLRGAQDYSLVAFKAQHFSTLWN